MTFHFSVWVDADSFPSRARSFVLSHAVPKSVPVVFVANREIDSGGRARMIVCQEGKDSADDHIFNGCSGNDIVLTRDILFAARLVDKKIKVMNDRGLIFTKDNIAGRLREREFSLNLAEIGLGAGKGSCYGDKELRKFSAVFAEELQKHIIADVYNVRG